MKNIKLNKLDVIHNYLEKPKYKVMILLLPIILCFVSDIVLTIVIYLNFNSMIFSIIKWTYIVSALLFILSTLFIIWSHYKGIKK